jgi:hypothetical protein
MAAPFPGRASLRAAIATYVQAGIDTATITGLATFFPHPPKITPEGDFVVASEDPGNSMGTVVYLYLGPVKHKRLGTGGPTSGIKAALYPATFICFTRSASDKSQDCGAANDAFIDSMRAYIEANRTADSAGVVWQWGEGEAFGQEDIEEDFTMPRRLRGKLGLTQVWGTLTVKAWQQYYA